MPHARPPRFALERARGYVPGVEAWTLWRGQRDTTRRALWVLLVLSLLLHLPLTPLARLMGLWRAFGDAGAPVDVPEMTGIPVDLIEEDEGPPTPPPPAPEPPPEPAVAPEPTAPAKDPEQPKAERDAGAPDAGPSDAGAEDAGSADAGPAADAGPSRDAGIADPIALKGDVRDVMDSNAAVQLRVYTARIRKLPLGARVGKLLGSIYQWRDFFGPAGIDPIRDVDQILVIGPQLRDSSGVVAVLKLRVPEQQIRQAIDHIVQADTAGGQWIEDAGVPVAIAQADRAPRAFVIAGPGVVVVAPPRLQEDVTRKAKALTRVLRDGGGAEVLSAKVKTPANALRGIFNAPRSIKQAKVLVVPTPDNGAEILIEAQDADAATAEESARYLESSVSVATEFDPGMLGSVFGFGKTKFVESVEFRAEGSTIHGRLYLTQKQIVTLLDLVGAYIGQPRPKRGPATPSAPRP